MLAGEEEQGKKRVIAGEVETRQGGTGAWGSCKHLPYLQHAATRPSRLRSMIDYPLKNAFLLLRQNSHFVAWLGVLQRAHVAPLHSLAEDHSRQARFPLHRC